jgi:NTE family protein
LDSPRRTPYFLEAEATLNQYDFFRSSNNTFFTDQQPSYILKSDILLGLNIGMPERNKGKIVLNASYIRLSDDYYQTKNFLATDTADQSVLKGPTASITYEVNTLNRKEYASQGTFLRMKLQYVNIREFTIPGSTSIDRSIQVDYHDWFQFKLNYENFFKKIGRFKVAICGDLAISNMRFFANYTSTSLNSPAFSPVQELQTLYLPALRTHNFAAAGLKSILSIKSNIEFNLEGYVFQPYQELIETTDKKTKYGPELRYRYYIASTGLVFHSPLGPIGLFVNYADMRTNSFSFLFHFGYFIFNKSALN